jgi:nitroimidazol reductase NimA-like FMN-containing flavoprotein (pyridoxamine 5'-phosphate oxidase superfamily)
MDHGGADLGRRITEYRRQAGLTREEAALRAGMASNYLSYLETSPHPDPTQASVARLAAVLGITSSTLGGAGLGMPPGGQAPPGCPVLEKLTAADCRSYLGTSGVGRFVYLEARGPFAVPVNYAMLGNDIVFRTGGKSLLANGAKRQPVSFEVDHLDESLAEGWSVLVSGFAVIVTTAAELDQVRSLGIVPWAGGHPDTYVRIIAHDMTGRRLRVGESPPGVDRP